MKTGIITKNNAPELELAFVKIRNLKTQIAITPNTKLIGCENISDLKIDQKIKITYKETSRGPLAIQVEIKRK